MNPLELQAKQDSQLFQQLIKTPEVEALNRQIAKQEEEGPLGTRRRLLATSVKLSKTMAPRLHAISEDCIDKLDVDIPIELFAYNSPQFNAACVKPEEGRLFIMFSSSLLDAFDDDELKFVMGHELGHFIYKHHDIPVGYLLNGQSRISPELALKLTSWSRYAEFSSDRAGAYCVQDFNAVARSLFKLSSGVTSGIVKFDLKEFLNQVDEMQLEDDNMSRSSMQDWFMTHPFSPLRVRALEIFHRSHLLMGEKGISQTDLELGIEGLMELMSPSYLEAKTDADKAMRNMLFAGSLCIANADGEISQEEIDQFESFFGKYQFNENLNLEKLESRLETRAERVVSQTSVAKRMQLIRDLCSIVKADQKTKAPELHMLHRIADLLQVPDIFVEQSLEPSEALD